MRSERFWAGLLWQSHHNNGKRKKVGGAGFEPAKSETTDLQSVPFDRFGTLPRLSFKTVSF